jgi:hypothetical protein
VLICQQMGSLFADDIRKHLKDAHSRLKLLGREVQAVNAERSEKHATLEHYFAAPDYRINTGDIILQIVALDKKLKLLLPAIKRQQDLCRELDAQLAVAPKRPRVRTKVATIAASGSKAIAAASEQQRQPPLSISEIWKIGLEIAQKTAKKKCGLERIPPASIEIMKKRMLEHDPKIEFFQLDNALYPDVRPLRSVRRN